MYIKRKKKRKRQEKNVSFSASTTRYCLSLYNNHNVTKMDPTKIIINTELSYIRDINVKFNQIILRGEEILKQHMFSSGFALIERDETDVLML